MEAVAEILFPATPHINKPPKKKFKKKCPLLSLKKKKTIRKNPFRALPG